MTAEQKERARHEVEVEKARQLKRIADALESLAMAHLTLRAETVPMSELIKKVDEGIFDRGYIAKEDLKSESIDELKIMIKRIQDRCAKVERRIEAIAVALINKEDLKNE
jgi:ribosomal protein S8